MENTEIFTNKSEVSVGMCRCCMSHGPIESMLLIVCVNDQVQSYAEILRTCFALDMIGLDNELNCDTKQVICERCISSLINAYTFRTQVETCMQAFREQLMFVDDVKKIKKDIQIEMEENECFSDGGDDYVDSMSIKTNIEESNVKEEFDDSDYIDVQIKRKSRKKTTIKNKKTLKILREKNPTDMMRKTRRKNNSKIDEDDVVFQCDDLCPFKWSRNCFQCIVCKERYVNSEELKTHMSSHDSNLIAQAFFRTKTRSERLKFETSSLKCKICSKNVSDLQVLKEHLKTEHNKKVTNNLQGKSMPFKIVDGNLNCHLCSETFLNFTNLNSHMNIHLSNYVCETCGKAFASRQRLKSHTRIHELGSFPCKQCDQIFDTTTKREHHVQKDHKSGGIRYSCPHCNIMITSFYARMKHLNSVHGEELKKYKCKLCSQRYVTPGHLSGHVRRDHLNERNYTCQQCMASFYTHHALKMHMVRHGGEKSFTCEICTKSYQRLKTLKEHMRIHNNDKRFVCPVCNKAFTQNCTLKGHMKVHMKKPSTEFTTEDLVVKVKL